MGSIRKRLTIALAIGFAVATLAAGAAVAHLLRGSVTEEFDAVLESKARALISLTEQDDRGRIILDEAVEAMPEYRRGKNPDYFQFWLATGRPLRRSSAEGGDLARDAAVPARPAHDVILPDGRPGRAIQVAFVPQVDDEDDEDDEGKGGAASPPKRAALHTVVLVVARGRESLDRLLGRVRLAVGGGCLGAILLAALLTWRLLVSGFRPIDRIAEQVRALDADNLGARIDAPTPREVAPVVDQLNALLARLEESFMRERRFAGNVAHELRTPIAELRSLAEVGRRWPDDRAAVERFFDDVTDISGHMETVVADLLLLARCQAGVEPAANAPTVLADVIEPIGRRLEDKAAGRNVRLQVDVPRDIVVRSDGGKLGIVFANLLGNAVSYASPDSAIRCRASTNGAGLELDITNQAERLSETELRRLSEPFWRRDEARSPAEHAGLGLSVVAAVAELLRLDLGFAQDPSGAFTVSLRGWNVSSS